MTQDSTGALREDLAHTNSQIDEKQIAPTVNPREREHILRKIDWHLLPIVTLLFLLSFLDRVNIGNAKVAGMSTDLNLTGFRYNIAAAVFFIPYSFAEIPSVQVIQAIALDTDYHDRMGPCDDLNVPCQFFLISSYNSTVPWLNGSWIISWSELLPFSLLQLQAPSVVSLRMVLRIWRASVACMAGNGLYTYVFSDKYTTNFIAYQFCLEGIATVLVAFLSFFVMQDYPATATFLTEQERAYVVNMLKEDANDLATYYHIRFVLQAMKDYKTYVQALIYIGLVVPGYAIALFSPTIINELGFSAANAQLLSVPPFVAGCIATILVGIQSDRHNLRGPYVIGGALVSLVGYVLLYCNAQAGPSYVGACLAAGIFSTVAVDLAWMISNAGGDLKRGVVIAMVVGFGNLGGICSSFIYIDPPRYHIGHGTVIGFLSFSIFMSMFAMWDYSRLNKMKEVQCRVEGYTNDRRGEFKDMADASPLFRYTI